jgi:diguanylate cyclase (GGDEF)-like protein
MTGIIRTRSHLLAWIAGITLTSMAVAIPGAALAVYTAFGGDLTATMTGYDSVKQAIVVSAILSSVLPSLLAYRTIETLRQLNVTRDDLDRLAHTDPLTGLLNRRGFDRVAARALYALTAVRGPAAVLMCDIDNFKSVNDRYGHEFGDVALRYVSDCLRRACDLRGAVLARLGGEEFVVLMPGVEAEAAAAFAERLRVGVSGQVCLWRGVSVTLTMSVGMAVAPFTEGQLGRLVQRADTALYAAKRRGRNCVVAADASRRAEAA